MSLFSHALLKYCLGLLLGALLCACGVKAPPVAPIQADTPLELKLQCAATDPECDRKDPQYEPQNPVLKKQKTKKK